MGMSASNAVASVQNQTVMNASQTCSTSTVSNNFIVCPSIDLDHCDNFTYTCGITGTGTMGCTAGQTSAAAQQAVTDATAKAKAALGAAFSNSESWSSDNLSVSLANTCSESQGQNNIVDGAAPVNCFHSNHDTISIIINCNLETQCQLGQALSAIQTAAASALSDAQGWDPISSLLGPISQVMKDAIVAVIVIVIVIALAGMGLITLKLVMGHHGGSQTGPAVQTQPQPRNYGNPYGNPYGN